MASAMRSYAQIPARTKFLIVTFAPSNDISDGPAPSDDRVVAFDISSTAHLNGTFFTDAAISATTGYTPLNVSIPEYEAALDAGRLYRDLGKQIVIVDANNNHVAYFRLVRLQNGVSSEGIGSDHNIWMKVWSASGEGVAVARTG